jgi:L-2-hydroxyglutarate oxidase LhgO
MDFDTIVIGAGVVGLAIAARLSADSEVLVLESQNGFGHGISSRNSEVVHAGIYYSPKSLKASLCVGGRQIIEQLATQGHFSYKRIGKFIIATDQTQLTELQRLQANGIRNGVLDLQMLQASELKKIEPAVKAVAALYSPSTAIIDSHGFMSYFQRKAETNACAFSYNSRVSSIKKIDAGYEIQVCGKDSQNLLQKVSAGRVINAAGLNSDLIAEFAGINVKKENLNLYWNRGEYYSLDSAANIKFQHLIYPVPAKEAGGHLGIHVTLDLNGRIRFGPSASWLDPLDSRIENYSQHENLKPEFYQNLKYSFLPGIKMEDLHPDGCGLRPRRFAPGEIATDFYIREESARGLKNFINLIGIESPGLTSAPAIAEMVADLLH